jgi:hypothetical protein
MQRALRASRDIKEGSGRTQAWLGRIVFRHKFYFRSWLYCIENVICPHFDHIPSLVPWNTCPQRVLQSVITADATMNDRDMSSSSDTCTNLDIPQNHEWRRRWLAPCIRSWGSPYAESNPRAPDSGTDMYAITAICQRFPKHISSNNIKHIL